MINKFQKGFKDCIKTKHKTEKDILDYVLILSQIELDRIDEKTKEIKKDLWCKGFTVGMIQAVGLNLINSK